MCLVRKVANIFLSSDGGVIFTNSIAGFSLQGGGAKKTLPKRNAEVYFAFCGKRQGLRALDCENFLKKVLSKTCARVCGDFQSITRRSLPHTP